MERPTQTSDESPADTPALAGGAGRTPRKDNLLAALADELHRIAFHLVRSLRRVDAATGANGPGLSALSVLARGRAPTIQELARTEGVTPPTISRLVRRLEREGFAAREVDPRDRRTVRVTVTRRGRALLRAGSSRGAARLQERLHGVSSDDLNVLARACAVLNRLLP